LHSNAGILLNYFTSQFVVLDKNALKEEFSYAYVHGVASVAGYICDRSSRQTDNDGIDATIRKPGKGKGRRKGLLDLQIKCSSVESSKVSINDDEIKFTLEVDSYSELIKESVIPIILVLVLVPNEVGDWTHQSEDSLILKKCGYYKQLQGDPETKNRDNIRISISKKQVFNPDCLNKLVKLM
jgi:hypothetical protein